MADREFLEELFEPVGRVDLKRMFGGLGAFRDGLMFALVLEDAIYLKSDAETRARFEAEGCGPFTYAKKTGQSVSLSYWRMPERLMDDAEEFRSWALEAVAVAHRGGAAKEAANRSAKTTSPRKRKSPT